MYICAGRKIKRIVKAAEIDQCLNPISLLEFRCRLESFRDVRDFVLDIENLGREMNRTLGGFIEKPEIGSTPYNVCIVTDVCKPPEIQQLVDYICNLSLGGEFYFTESTQKHANWYGRPFGMILHVSDIQL